MTGLVIGHVMPIVARSLDRCTCGSLVADACMQICTCILPTYKQTSDRFSTGSRGVTAITPP